MSNHSEHVIRMISEFLFAVRGVTATKWDTHCLRLLKIMIKERISTEEIEVMGVKIDMAHLDDNTRLNIAQGAANKAIEEISEALKEDRWICAIKILRNKTGLSLKDSKDIIDSARRDCYKSYVLQLEIESLKETNAELQGKCRELFDTNLDLKIQIDRLQVDRELMVENINSKENN